MRIPLRIIMLKILVAIGFLTFAAAYEAGVIHRYSYETKVLIDETCDEGPEKHVVGHGLKAGVQVTVLWQSPQKETLRLIKITISQLKSIVGKQSSFVSHESKLDEIKESSCYFVLEDGILKQFWDSSNDDHSVSDDEMKNLKRSIASILQFQETEKQNVKEHDISGHCDVSYQVKGSIIRKTKRNCVSPLFDTSLSQAHGVRSSTLQRVTTIGYETKKEKSTLITKCTATDYLKTFSNIWRKPSFCLLSKSILLLEESTQNGISFSQKNLEEVIKQLRNENRLAETDIDASSLPREEKSPRKLLDVLKNHQEGLKTTNLAKLNSALTFSKLLTSFRSASKEDILNVLSHRKFSPIMPQILDLTAASGTKNSLDAVSEHFAKTKDYDENFERYLISISVLPRPESHVLKTLMSFAEKNEHDVKTKATLISTLGAVLKTYAARNENSNSQVVEEVRTYLETQLRKCRSESCSLIYLHGLRNAAQPKSYGILLEYGSKGGRQALEALLALKSFSVSLPSEIQQTLLKIFHQVGQKQDRSTRSIAAEILLQSNPEDDVIKSILSTLSDQSDAELSTYITSKVMNLMDTEEGMRSKLKNLLSEKDISHYYSLAQKGSSSAFKRPLLTADGTNVTYSIDMEMLEGGLLKRSVFDVNIESAEGMSNLLTVGMFAEGLASFAGGSSDGDNDQSPSAGMELTLLGSSLRPYIFFSSTSELMSHAWSGTASEPTPALQGIFLLSDDENVIVLSNGMTVRLETRAVLSTDLSASIQISLWSRNSQSQVKNAGALLVKSVAKIDSSVASTKAGFQFTGDSAIDFNTDLDFSESPFKMCLQMHHPDITIRHDFQRSTQITGSKFLVKRTKKRKRFINGKSFVLYPRNNEQCKEMNYE